MVSHMWGLGRLTSESETKESRNAGWDISSWFGARSGMRAPDGLVPVQDGIYGE